MAIAYDSSATCGQSAGGSGSNGDVNIPGGPGIPTPVGIGGGTSVLSTFGNARLYGGGGLGATQPGPGTTPGTTGATGTTGASGIPGVVGYTGSIGYTGSVGPMGNIVAADTVSLNNITVSGFSTIRSVQENMSLVYAAGATPVTHDYSQSSIFYHIAPTSNFTVNLINYPTTANIASVITLVLQQGTTARYASGISINGQAATIKNFNGAVPTVRSNKIDIQSITIFNANGVYNVTSQTSTFG